jgi:hypothetical protein
MTNNKFNSYQNKMEEQNNYCSDSDSDSDSDYDNSTNNLKIQKIENKQKISAYIILFGDLGFLDDIIGRIYEFVDEIILVDGPYSYNADILKKLKLHYDKTDKPEELVKILIKYSHKIKYIYKTFRNEEQKRMTAYTSCSNNIVLLVDCDEFLVINEKHINNFINSPKKVAGFDIYNMNRTNINMNDKVRKNILFKKQLISPSEHLDYTWLVGCKQNSPNSEFIYTDSSMGKIYHQTLNRNKKDNIIKYIFYISLHYYNKNNNQIVDVNDLKLIGDYTINELLEDFSLDEILNIFYHSKMELIGMPSDKEKILGFNSKVTINIDKYRFNHYPAIFNSKETAIAVRYTPYFCYIDVKQDNIKEIKITFSNVIKIKLSIFQIYLYEPFTVKENIYDTNDNVLSFPYLFTKENNYFSTIFELNCLETMDGLKKYNIKSIECL